MEKVNKFLVIALSIILLLMGAAKTIFEGNPEDVPGKSDILYDPKVVAAYDLCDAARDMLKASVVLYAGSPAALINGAPHRLSINNSQVVPIIDNNEVYVPAAFIAGALGAQVSRHAGAAAMMIKAGHSTISFVIGQAKASVNGTQLFLPYPTFVKYGEVYIHLPSICQILGKNVLHFGNIILISPMGQAVDLKEEKHIINDLAYYFNDGTIPHNRDIANAAVNGKLKAPAVTGSFHPLLKNRRIKVCLNEDELNSQAFPVTEIDPNASEHDHSLIMIDNVIMAPVVLLRLLEVEVFESVKPNAMSLLEAAPFGNYISLTIKPGSTHAYLNLQGEDPYKDEEAFKDRMVILPAAPRLINQHLYIPIIEICRLLGTKADWDQRSNSVKICSMASPRFPNLHWAPQRFHKMKADYEMTMAIRLKGSEGKEMSRLDYSSSGYYDSGEYAGRAAVRTSSESSGSSETLYYVKRYLNKDFEYEYSAAELKGQTTETRSAAVDYSETLLTDMEYLRRKIELLAVHFHASDLLKKQPDISLGEKTVDKYSIELTDMASIVELFGIRSLPGIAAGESMAYKEDGCIFENLRMELCIDKEGQVVNCSINYHGHMKSGRPAASRNNDEQNQNITYEVSINADFSPH